MTNFPLLSALKEQRTDRQRIGDNEIECIVVKIKWKHDTDNLHTCICSKVFRVWHTKEGCMYFITAPRA
jgi:hypothetical protein